MTRTYHDQPCFQLRLVAEKDVVLGPGKADLLDRIDACGSISAASRELGMSYKKAWQLIDTMNRHFPSPLITTAAGGAEGGGAQVTPLGRQVLDHYRALQRRLDRDVCEHADALLKLMRPDALAAED
ncbi:MAG: LysR family transcriptional regulator [Halomonas sp.]|uniref:LysR family transcriptional regulator n=3 Tax=Halomonas TaxID=2745 RepID=A0A7X4W565_9GAMM|nr:MULTISPECIES: LysR family transcriptional regulator [Halomonas]NAW33326.1 LysR family transcriptional regulator [Halomonas alimentaria]NWN84202.1 LysR family transcriptional regulator [Halomonas sp.]